MGYWVFLACISLAVIVLDRKNKFCFLHCLPCFDLNGSLVMVILSM